MKIITVPLKWTKNKYEAVAGFFRSWCYSKPKPVKKIKADTKDVTTPTTKDAATSPLDPSAQQTETKGAMDASGMQEDAAAPKTLSDVERLRQLEQAVKELEAAVGGAIDSSVTQIVVGGATKDLIKRGQGDVVQSLKGVGIGFFKPFAPMHLLNGLLRSPKQRYFGALGVTAGMLLMMWTQLIEKGLMKAQGLVYEHLARDPEKGKDSYGEFFTYGLATVINLSLLFRYMIFMQSLVMASSQKGAEDYAERNQQVAKDLPSDLRAALMDPIGKSAYLAEYQLHNRAISVLTLLPFAGPSLLRAHLIGHDFLFQLYSAAGVKREQLIKILSNKNMLSVGIGLGQISLEFGLFFALEFVFKMLGSNNDYFKILGLGTYYFQTVLKLLMYQFLMLASLEQSIDLKKDEEFQNVTFIDHINKLVICPKDYQNGGFDTLYLSRVMVESGFHRFVLSWLPEIERGVEARNAIARELRRVRREWRAEKVRRRAARGEPRQEKSMSPGPTGLHSPKADTRETKQDARVVSKADGTKTDDLRRTLEGLNLSIDAQILLESWGPTLVSVLDKIKTVKKLEDHLKRVADLLDYVKGLLPSFVGAKQAKMLSNIILKRLNEDTINELRTFVEGRGKDANRMSERVTATIFTEIVDPRKFYLRFFVQMIQTSFWINSIARKKEVVPQKPPIVLEPEQSNDKSKDSEAISVVDFKQEREKARRKRVRALNKRAAQLKVVKGVIDVFYPLAGEVKEDKDMHLVSDAEQDEAWKALSRDARVPDTDLRLSALIRDPAPLDARWMAFQHQLAAWQVDMSGWTREDMYKTFLGFMKGAAKNTQKVMKMPGVRTAFQVGGAVVDATFAGVPSTVVKAATIAVDNAGVVDSAATVLGNVARKLEEVDSGIEDSSDSDVEDPDAFIDGDEMIMVDAESVKQEAKQHVEDLARIEAERKAKVAAQQPQAATVPSTELELDDMSNGKSAAAGLGLNQELRHRAVHVQQTIQSPNDPRSAAAVSTDTDGYNVGLFLSNVGNNLGQGLGSLLNLVSPRSPTTVDSADTRVAVTPTLVPVPDGSAAVRSRSRSPTRSAASVTEAS